MAADASVEAHSTRLNVFSTTGANNMASLVGLLELYFGINSPSLTLKIRTFHSGRQNLPQQIRPLAFVIASRVCAGCKCRSTKTRPVRYRTRMKQPLFVSRPPDNPVLIYDGECGFCRRMVRLWQNLTRGAAAALPLQSSKIASMFPELDLAKLEVAVHWVDTTGRVTEGAEAAFHSVESVFPCLIRLHQNHELAREIAEKVYHWVARNRKSLSAVACSLFGPNPPPVDE